MPERCLFRWWIVALGLLLAAGTVRAQTTDVAVGVEPDGVGLGGTIRPGSWTPLRVSLDNRTSQPLRVRCQWELTDADGETVQAQRTVTLTPQRRQSVLLYGLPPASMEAAKTNWRVQVVEEESGRLLGAQAFRPNEIVSPSVRAIGITGAKDLGLKQGYEKPYTQQEATRLIHGLDPARMPDRWYGFEALQALVWTSEGGDPAAPNISPDTHTAIREWVRRGGHLIISLPSTGDLWSGSPLRDLLPPVNLETVTEVSPPLFLGTPLPDTETTIDVKVLEPTGPAAVLARGRDNRPLIVAHQFGLGRVTLIGIDLSDKRLYHMGLLSAQRGGVWDKVFGWRGPILSESYIESLRKQGVLADPDYRHPGTVDDFIGVQTAMTGDASLALLLALMLFILYWIVAGPAAFLVLKGRGEVRHAWLTFTLVVAAVSGVAWAGAWLLRPSRERIEHFTALDFDAQSGVAHAHSWLALFVPQHGRVEVAVDPAHLAEHRDTLGAPGLMELMGDRGFIDPQRYTLDGGTPGRVAYPFRATSKAIEIDYLGRWRDTEGPPKGWIAPQGRVSLGKSGWPEGKLVHGLPGTLTNVRVVFCPGGDRTLDRVLEPRVWAAPDWKAGEPLELKGVPLKWQPLAEPPPPGHPEEAWRGFLGDIAKRVSPSLSGDGGSGLGMVDSVWALSFYDVLPAPRWEYPSSSEIMTSMPVVLRRTAGRRLDLSAMTQLRRVIVIGFLERAPMPVPMTVSGAEVPAVGTTVVRWVAPIEEEP